MIFNVEECEILYNEKLKNKFVVNKFKMNVEVKIFKKLKILNIEINKEFCKIFKIKFRLNVIKKMKDKQDSSFGFIIKNLNELNPDINKINLNLSIGTEDMIITTFLVPILSTIISIFISKYFSENKERDCYLKITPNFLNINNFSFKCITKIKLNTLRFLFFIKKHREIKA